MTIAKFLIYYLTTLVVFVFIDALWLGLIAPRFYQTHLGHLLSPEINWWAAGLFYLIFIAGLILFVIQPAIEQGSLGFALTYGAMFGLVTYATYDLTNLATLKDWPIVVVVADLLWGIVLSATVSCLSYLILTRLASKQL